MSRFQYGDSVSHNGRPATIMWVIHLEHTTRYSIVYNDDEGGHAGYPNGLLGRVLQDR